MRRGRWVHGNTKVRCTKPDCGFAGYVRQLACKAMFDGKTYGTLRYCPKCRWSMYLDPDCNAKRYMPRPVAPPSHRPDFGRPTNQPPPFSRL